MTPDKLNPATQRHKHEAATKMETRLLHCLSLKLPPPSPRLSAFRRQTLFRIRASDAADQNQPPLDPPAETQIPPTPPEPLEIRYRRGSRKRRKLREEGVVGSATKQELATRTKSEPKKWDEMTVVEKAVEIYMGEKGLLFWLNKFAYASIFIVIGGWVLFRFVGPSLNLYQLDTSPLAPQSMFKG